MIGKWVLLLDCFIQRIILNDFASQGKAHYTIDSGISGFCNHGCNGTYNYGDNDIDFTEMNVDENQPVDSLFNQAHVYSPIFERHLRQILGTGDETLRQIKKGEEIFCNYLSFIGHRDDWKEDIER